MTRSRPLDTSHHMEPAIIAATIGLTGTITSPIIVELVKRRLANRQLPDIPAARVAALQGRWIGSYHQEVSPIGELDGTLSLAFTIVGKQVTGDVQQQVDWAGEVCQHSFTVTGAFQHYRFLMLLLRLLNG